MPMSLKEGRQIIKSRFICFDKIRQKYEKFFEKNAFIEIIFSEMCDEYNFKELESYYKQTIKTIGLVAIGLINRVKKIESPQVGVFEILLDRPNDWGLIWPLVVEFDQHGKPYYLKVSSDCYNGHKDEIERLENKKVLLSEDMSSWKNMSLSFGDIIDTFWMVRKSVPLFRKYPVGTWCRYIFLHSMRISLARGMYNRYFNRCNFSVSLGSRIFGYLYQMYGIRHFGVQHGVTDPQKVGIWTTLTKANVYCAFTYGDYFSKVYQNAYGTNCHAIGNCLYGDIQEFNEEASNIVFFADFHALLKSGNKREIEVLDSTLDMLVALKRALPETIHLKIKLHPNDNKNLDEKLQRICKENIEILDGKIRAEEVLKDTFIAVSWGNSVSLEAIHAGSIAIQIDKKQFLFARQEYAYQYQSIDDLISLVNNKRKLKELYHSQFRISSKYVKKGIPYSISAVNYIVNSCT